ncbi:OLC1v1008948C1 [Oldenlandia corymbosa var. corymbosa]|uniref:OLC1v1008948C1 n=1 Tax=Oldenlandia corymbosa var. corymbosa TaxID=529605 RepID=A0AAV1DQ95_OLDCO|nr:OLC1v1008948C1 [Oldenlandia corymbosa var. corymbosa]
MAGISPPVAPPPRTLASFFQKPPEVEVNVDSLIKQVKFVNGTPTLEYEDEEFERLVVPHRLCLVGKFSYGRPKMEEIHNEFKKIGFQGGYTLGLMNPRHVLIRFDQEEDYQRCWIRTFWNIGGYSMRILKWKPGFKFEKDPPVVPIRVSLYDLPIEFMHPEVIFSMATALGKPLKVDAPTLNMTRSSSCKIGHKEEDCREGKPPPEKQEEGMKMVEPAPKKKVAEKSSIPVDILAAATPASTSNRFAVLEMIEEEDELVVVNEDEHVQNVFIKDLPPPQPSIQQQSILPEIGSGVYSPIDQSQDDGDVGRTSVATELEAGARGSSLDGDIDDALDEYSGNSVQDQVAMTEFNEFILECDLLELPVVGEVFTWGGTRHTGLVSKRLDRDLISQELSDLFPSFSLENISKTTSDHCPLLHKFDVNIESKSKIFRFRKMWLKRSDFKEVVKENWEQPLGVSAKKKASWSRVSKVGARVAQHTKNRQSLIPEIQGSLGSNINDFLATHIRDCLDDNGNNDDLLVWKHNSIGDLTVKSAYDVIRPRRQSEGWARNVWNPFTPLRVSIFLWKLRNRLVPFPEVWRHFSAIVGVNILRVSLLAAMLNRWWNGVDFKIAYGEMRNLIPSLIIWQIWKCQNKVTFEGTAPDLAKVIRTIVDQAGYGFVIKGAWGSFIYGENGYLGDGDSFMAEVYRILFGLRKCEQPGLSNIVVQTDNKSLADSLERGSIFPWKYLLQLQEIYAYLQRNAFTISHIYREGNAVVDMIAKKASSGSSGV